ncbi:hypothetical protein Ciccas_014242, partial [Cichlidogyrus casuarinus]
MYAGAENRGYFLPLGAMTTKNHLEVDEDEPREVKIVEPFQYSEASYVSEKTAHKNRAHETRQHKLFSGKLATTNC